MDFGWNAVPLLVQTRSAGGCADGRWGYEAL